MYERRRLSVRWPVVLVCVVPASHPLTRIAGCHLQGMGRCSPGAKEVLNMTSVHSNASLYPLETTVTIQYYLVSSMFNLSVKEMNSQPNVVSHYGQVYISQKVCISGSTGSEIRGFKPGRSRWIVSEHKNPEYDFLRKVSKAVGPMS